MNNHWGWDGFTTQDLKRCRLLARSIGLIYNWWSLFVRLADPEHYREAITKPAITVAGHCPADPPCWADQADRQQSRRLVTDGLRSYGVAHREVLPDVRHRTSCYLNNRAENSHRPTRRRERQMQRFKSSAQAQRFLSAHGMIYGHFRPRRHLVAADAYRRARAKAFRVWKQETRARVAA
ncbi:MAG: IS6 family transposase [Acetobacteraceae bacterium]|nr:IS6 family transposase [Acetobacteraceae bacterium]